MNASTSAKVLAPTVKLLINGKLVESQSTQWRDVVNPATQEVLARVPFATPDEVNAAVANAKEAFKTWRKTPIGARARIFLKYQQLIRENMKELAAILTADRAAPADLASLAGRTQQFGGGRRRAGLTRQQRLRRSAWPRGRAAFP